MPIQHGPNKYLEDNILVLQNEQTELPLRPRPSCVPHSSHHSISSRDHSLDRLFAAKRGSPSRSPVRQSLFDPKNPSFDPKTPSFDRKSSSQLFGNRKNVPVDPKNSLATPKNSLSNPKKSLSTPKNSLSNPKTSGGDPTSCVLEKSFDLERDLDISNDLVRSADQPSALPILPAVPRVSHRLHARAHTVLSDDMCPPTNITPSVYLQTTSDGKIQAIRPQRERDKYPDRINLDRRGLSQLPHIVNEAKLRLLSIQHNLLTSLDGFSTSPASLTTGQGNLTTGSANSIGQDNLTTSHANLTSSAKLTTSQANITGSTKLTSHAKLTTEKSNTGQANSIGQANLSTDKANLSIGQINLSGSVGPAILTGSVGPSNLSDCSANPANLTSSVGPANLTPNSAAPANLSGSNNPSTTGFGRLVFLDVYDNQIERISGLDALVNLRVLLLGKNRIKSIEGLKCLVRLEVLDLHGNQITQISNLNTLGDLKVLNLAGNQIRTIGCSDLEGLKSLQELNLRRNRLTRLLGFGQTPRLIKLFLNNNQLQCIDDMSSVATLVKLEEINIDENPVATSGSCVSYLVSYLPSLLYLNKMSVTEHVRHVATAWRATYECSDQSGGIPESRRDQVICNARTNWELLRTAPAPHPGSAKLSASLKDLRAIPEERAGEALMGAPDCKRDSFVRRRTLSQESASSSHNSSQNSGLDYIPLPPILANDEVSSNKGDSGSVTSSIEQHLASSSSPLHSEISDDDRSSRLSTSDSSSDSESSSGCQDNGKSASKNGAATGQGQSVAEFKVTKPAYRRSLSSAKINSMDKTSPGATDGGKPPGLKRSTSAKSNTPSGVGRQRSEMRNASKVREQGGDYLIEINGRYLNIYGQGSLRFIDRPWNPIKSSDVTTIRFNYINFNSLTSVLNKVKTRFPNIEYLEFKETNIYCLGQINAIADIQGLTSLHIHADGNSILQKKDWRYYAIYRLSHWGLKIINDIEISEQESLEASSQFSGLGDLVLSCLPDSLLEPLLSRLRLDKQAEGMTAKQWLFTADPALKSVLSKEALQWRRNATTLHQDDGQWRHRGRLHLNYLIELTCSATGKLNTLHVEWGSILNELVRDILVDYSQIDVYMRKCIDKL
ncbi:hypothetical protein M8J76_008307 [Diaphorina citri]|nr:hypothetical protein M8J76_008307 [Diaphorina citri]